MVTSAPLITARGPRPRRPSPRQGRPPDLNYGALRVDRHRASRPRQGDDHDPGERGDDGEDDDDFGEHVVSKLERCDEI